MYVCNLQKQNANPNDRKPVSDLTTKVTPTFPLIMLMFISIISLVQNQHMIHLMCRFRFLPEVSRCIERLSIV